MDALSSVLSRIALRAGVFYSGNICGLHDFAHDVFKGHLHLIQRGPIVLQTLGQADVQITEPTVLFMPRPQWHRLLADDGAGADVVCGAIALGGGVNNPVSASLPDVLQAIRAGQTIADAKLAALYAMTSTMVKTNGQPDPTAVQAFLAAGYQESDLLYIVLAISVKVLSNFSNHAFGTVVDERFAAYKVA